MGRARRHGRRRAGHPDGVRRRPEVFGRTAREIRALAARARGGSIAPPELGGATFTVASLAAFGVSSFTAIVNPPQAAILAVGTVAPRPAARARHEDSGTRSEAAHGEIEGAGAEIVVRETMTATLACDHRILDAAGAARFLARVRELLEAPAALAL